MALILAAGLVGCGSSAATATPVSAEGVTTQASQKMTAVNAFHFRIDVTGSGAYLDTARTMRLNFTEGDLAKPDKVKADLNLALMGLIVETQAVFIGPDRFFKNPLTQKWETMPKDWGYDPTVLFDPVQGISGVVKKITGMTLAGTESIDGVDCYHVTGTVKVDDIRQLTAGMIGGDQVKLDIWIGKSDSYVRQLIIEEQPGTPVQDSKPTVWTMKLSAFDQPVTIERPV
jgi:hypothetical protein